MMKAKYSHLPDGAYELREEHVADVAETLARSFLKRNEVWSKSNLNHQQLQAFFLKVIQNHLNLQEKTCKRFGRKVFLNTISIENGHLVASSLHYDIHEYREMIKTNSAPHIPFFNRLERYGEQLMKKISLDEFNSGECIYFSFGSRTTNQRRPLISTLHALVEKYALLKEQGYRHVIGRISHQNLRAIYQGMGSQIVSKVTIGNMDGKEHFLYFAVLDLQNQTFVKLNDQIKQYRSNQRQINAKL